MLKTIIFDLGRVIVPFEFERGFALIAPHAGLTPEAVAARMRETDLMIRYERGELESGEFVEQLGRWIGFSLRVAEFAPMWSSIFLPHTLIPESLLLALKGSYRLVLLSNTNAMHFEFLERQYPLLRHFDEHVLSFRAGAVKPEARIFEAAIAAARCRPEECFFTDDIPAYVEAARGHGIDAVVFENADRTMEELRRRGVAV
jgi:putative hydrolase of the HAD superfamily